MLLLRGPGWRRGLRYLSAGEHRQRRAVGVVGGHSLGPNLRARDSTVSWFFGPWDRQLRAKPTLNGTLGGGQTCLLLLGSNNAVGR